MRDRQDVAGGTLDRLNDALSSLEQKIGIARQQAAAAPAAGDFEALSAIRARQSALAVPQRETNRAYEPRRNVEVPAQMNTDLLREELSELRHQMERQMSGQVSAGVESIRDDLRSFKSQQPAVSANVSAATMELRQDIAALKDDVARLAREDTLQDMLERWSVLEREIADLPQKLGSRNDLIAMAERLDDVQNSIAAMPQTSGMLEVEEQVRTLAVAVEHLAANSGDANFPMESIDTRFDELSRAIAAMPANITAPAPLDGGAFERIEARIASLATQLDEHARTPVTHGLEGQLSELASGLNQLREETRSSSPVDAMTNLSQRIEDISQHLAAQPAASTFDEQAFTDMNERLVYVIEHLNSTNDTAQKTAETIVSSFDHKMDEIAKRIDDNERNSAAVPSIDTLEMRLDEIAQLLSNGGATDASNSGQQLSSLEAQVAALTHSLSANNISAIDEESLLSAARAAADEAVARYGANASNPAAAELNNLAGDLKALEGLARDSDDRNTRTFGAIHDTLLKVVDHLAGLEDTIRTVPAPSVAQRVEPAETSAAPLVPASAMMAHEPETPRMPEAYDAFETPDVAQTPRINVPDAPSVAPMDEFDGGYDAPSFEEPVEEVQEARGALSPAAAAVAAARAALDDDAGGSRTKLRAPADAASSEPESKSLLKGMAEKLRRGVSKDAPETQDIEIASEQVNAEGFGETFVSDEPIEPGSGGADLSAIMRRVREERAGTAPNPAATVASNVEDNGKSDFIAAARRAAKAAAADATVVSREGGKRKQDKASLGAMLAQKRKPILMGAGAILLALLSLPLISGYFSSPEVGSAGFEETAELAAAPDIEETAAIAESDVEAPVVRNVEIAPDVNSLEDPLALGVDDGAEQVAVGQSVDVAQAAEFELSDIPENVGPIVLREAAASGDPKALYVVGDYYTGGVPGKSENDLGKALQWYERSAELGFAPAQYRVGNFYEKGLGTERDFDTAKTWYQLAAEQGNAAAMHNLAVLFASGADGAPDFASATRWFQDAAEFGVKDSQFNLGILSAKGEGIAQDLTESYKWFAIAAKTGDKDAEAKRDEVAEALRPDQLEVARGAAELWKPKQLNDEVNMVNLPDEWQTDVAQTAAAKPKLAPAEMKKAVRNIQGILNNNGFNAGPADGIMGAKTREAIIAFKKANGMEENAEVNEALVRKLLEVNSANAS